MASGAETTRLSARFLGADQLERARANALSCPLWQSGALVEPTEAGSTVTIFDRNGEAMLGPVAVTVTDKIATRSYTPDASQDFEEGWMVEWSLIVAGTTHVFRNDAMVVRNRLYPVVTDDDLYRRMRSLDPNSKAPITNRTNFQTERDDAWGEIQRRLVRLGNRPNLIMNPSELYDVHRLLTIANVFDDLATVQNDYKETADDFRSKYNKEWSELRFLYDEDEDGTPDSNHRRSATPSIWLTSRQ